MSTNFNVSLTALTAQSASQGAQQQQSAADAAAAAQTAQKSAAQADSVQLSIAAQVKELNQEGLSASTIASALGLTAKEVDSYLNVLPTAVVESAAQLAAVGKGGGKA